MLAVFSLIWDSRVEAWCMGFSADSKEWFYRRSGSVSCFDDHKNQSLQLFGWNDSSRLHPEAKTILNKRCNVHRMILTVTHNDDIAMMGIMGIVPEVSQDWPVKIADAPPTGLGSSRQAVVSPSGWILRFFTVRQCSSSASSFWILTQCRTMSHNVTQRYTMLHAHTHSYCSLCSWAVSGTTLVPSS